MKGGGEVFSKWSRVPGREKRVGQVGQEKGQEVFYGREFDGREGRWGEKFRERKIKKKKIGPVQEGKKKESVLSRFSKKSPKGRGGRARKENLGKGLIRDLKESKRGRGASGSITYQKSEMPYLKEKS